MSIFYKQKDTNISKFFLKKQLEILMHQVFPVPKWFYLSSIPLVLLSPSAIALTQSIDVMPFVPQTDTTVQTSAYDYQRMARFFHQEYHCDSFTSDDCSEQSQREGDEEQIKALALNNNGHSQVVTEGVIQHKSYLGSAYQLLETNETLTGSVHIVFDENKDHLDWNLESLAWDDVSSFLDPTQSHNSTVTAATSMSSDNALTITGGTINDVGQVNAAGVHTKHTMDIGAVAFSDGRFQHQPTPVVRTGESDLVVHASSISAFNNNLLLNDVTASHNALTVSGGVFNKVDALVASDVRNTLHIDVHANSGMLGGLVAKAGEVEGKLVETNQQISSAAFKGNGFVFKTLATDNHLNIQSGTFNDTVNHIAAAKSWNDLSDVKVRLQAYTKEEEMQEQVYRQFNNDNPESAVVIEKQNVGTRESASYTHKVSTVFMGGDNRLSSYQALNNNKVEILGGTFSQGVNDVYGVILGQEQYTDVMNGEVGMYATNNQVKVNTALAVHHALGGAAAYWQQGNRIQHTVQLQNNHVTVGENVTFGRDSVLAGAVALAQQGDGEYGVDYAKTFQSIVSTQDKVDLFSGNTLVLNRYAATSTVGTVGNFQYYEFDLPKNFNPSTDSGLYAQEVYLHNPNNFSERAAVSRVVFNGHPDYIQVGGKVSLIKANHHIYGEMTNTHQLMNIESPWFLVMSGQLEQQNNEVFLRVKSKAAAPQAKVFSEGNLAGFMGQLQAADLIANQSIAAARDSVNYHPESIRGFAAIGGSHSRYKTGSYFDANTLSLLVGGAYGIPSSSGHLTLGGFFEAGRSNYDTINGFENAETLKGDGKAHYEGIGVLARFDAKNGVYVEGSLRAGKTHNRFSGDFTPLRNINALVAYKIAMPYYGGHLGVGYLWNASANMNVDIYGRYTLAYQKSKQFMTNRGDDLSFEHLTSQRIRVGARAHWKVKDRVEPYVGVAFEQELAGKAKASIYSLPIEAPSLKGSIGVAELGMRILPSANSHLSVDAGVTAYTGKRREIAGGLQVKYRY